MCYHNVIVQHNNTKPMLYCDLSMVYSKVLNFGNLGRSAAEANIKELLVKAVSFRAILQRWSGFSLSTGLQTSKRVRRQRQRCHSFALKGGSFQESARRLGRRIEAPKILKEFYSIRPIRIGNEPFGAMAEDLHQWIEPFQKMIWLRSVGTGCFPKRIKTPRFRTDSILRDFWIWWIFCCSGRPDMISL